MESQHQIIMALQHTSRKSEENTENSMLKKNNLHQGHEVKQHGNKIEADG
jgi:hypothetical protein